MIWQRSQKVPIRSWVIWHARQPSYRRGNRMNSTWMHRGTAVLVVLVMSLIGGLVGAQMGPPMGAPSGRSRVEQAALAFSPFALVGQPEALAQSTQKVYRVGILGQPPSPSPLVQQFTDELRALGYVPGQNIVFEYRGSEDKNERFGQLVSDLIAQKVDVIFSSGTPATRAAKQVTSTVPIVFVIALDPVALGFVNSLEKPGGNLTGVTEESPELPGKRVALLKEVVPQVKKIGIVWDADAFPDAFEEKVGREMASKTEQAARAIGTEAEVIAVRGPADLENAFASLARARVDGLVVDPIRMFSSQAARVAELAAKHKIPTIYTSPRFAQVGGLISMGADLTDAFRRAAGYVDKILKGAAPSDLPVGQTEKFALVINTKAARDMGLTIPQSVLARADRVIE
jgi:putative ABC transport system substrate-binding protein